jgi:hypothetical protein
MQQVKKYGKKQRMEFLNHVSVQLWGIWEQSYANFEKKNFLTSLHCSWYERFRPQMSSSSLCGYAHTRETHAPSDFRHG